MDENSKILDFGIQTSKQNINNFKFKWSFVVRWTYTNTEKLS